MSSYSSAPWQQQQNLEPQNRNGSAGASATALCPPGSEGDALPIPLRSGSGELGQPAEEEGGAPLLLLQLGLRDTMQQQHSSDLAAPFQLRASHSAPIVDALLDSTQGSPRQGARIQRRRSCLGPSDSGDPPDAATSPVAEGDEEELLFESGGVDVDQGRCAVSAPAHIGSEALRHWREARVASAEPLRDGAGAGGSPTAVPGDPPACYF
jgi:hypothetical protein